MKNVVIAIDDSTFYQGYENDETKMDTKWIHNSVIASLLSIFTAESCI